MNKDTLIGRVAQVLTDLEFLSEAAAATPPDKKVGGHVKAASTSPAGIGAGNEFEFHYRSIENMVRAAEKAFALAQRRQLPKDGNLEFWVLQDEGKDSRWVAETHGTSAERVRQIRNNAGRDPTLGRVK